MPLLLISDTTDARPRIFELKRAKLRIGRQDADLILPNVSVSRNHCTLTERGHTHLLEDAGSNNGTLVNGQPLSGSHELQHKDKIGVGQYELQYLDEDLLKLTETEQLSALAPWSATGSAGGESTFVMSAGLQKKLQRKTELRDRGALFPKGGTPVRLGVDARRVGPKAEIACKNWWPFGDVAELSWSGSGHVLKKVGMGKVLVRGKAPTTRPLVPGDTLEIGGSEFRYDLLSR